MASQDEDNKLECISNVNKEQERYFLNVYKKHECILNNKNESFENKVESLIEVWRSVGELNLSQFDIRHVIQIMDWAKLHALNIVLTAEWNSFKATHQSKLLQEIEKAQNELLKLNSGFATRCKKLADVVKNPWEDVVLMKLMKTKNAEIGPEEIEFFCVETAYVVSVRLKKLCESHCEDLALNLVTAFMNCNKLSKTQNFSLNATETQMWFIFDIYIALLYKFQEKQKMVLLLKELTFEEGLQLVKRFAKKRVKISKIWKSCQRIAVLATQMYISQAVVKYTDDLKGILESYIEMYVSLCNTDSLLQDFSTSIRRISNLADAAGLYIFCAVIQKTAGAKLKTFVIEMYIRALTTDMNELERQKDANEKEKVAATTSRLAAAFCNLADFLDEHVKVARECVLTAFSLEPTKERLKTIETLARRSGFQVLDTGQEWKCRLHPPVLPSDDIAWMCPECGDWMCKPQLNIPLKINMALNEALQNSVLGISEALCDDLVVCLSNPRYQILSWFLPWDDLHRLCIMYLQDPETTKNFVTELKFVDIDYSIFKGIKREPLDELAGIERGYEQYLDQDFVSDEETSSVSEDSMSQDSRPYSLGSDGAGEGPYLPMLPPQPKSDPNTLKSLRMFRPSLKRPKANGSTDDLPQKLHKVDSAVNTNHPHTVTSNFKGPPKNENSASLSSFLNGISSTSPQLSAVNSQDSHSKNVKAATLPPLGGQVANLIKPIQVKLQPLTKLCQVKEKSPQTPKHTAGQALKPYNQTKGTISESTRKDLVLKILSKSSLNGAKENSNSSKTGQNSELSTVRPLEMPSLPTTEKATQNPEVPSEVSTPQTLIPSTTRQQVQQHLGMQTHQPTKAHSLAVKGNSHPKRSTSCLPACTKSQLQSPKTQMPPLQNIPTSQVSQPQEINHIGTQTRQPAIAHSSVVKENSHPKRLTNCLPASTKSQIPNTETTPTSHSCHLQKLNPQKTAPVTKNAQIEETVATRIPQVNQIKNSQNSANCLPVSKNTRVQDMNDIKIAHLNQSEKSNVKQSQKCQKPNQLDALELELLTTSLTPHLGRWELPNMDLPPNYAPQPSAQLNPRAQPNKSRLNPSGPLSNLPPPVHPKTGNQPVLGKLNTPQGKCSVPLKSDKVQKLMSPQDKASPSSPLMKHQELTPLSPDRTLIVPLNPSLVDTLVSSYTKNNSEPSKDRQPQVQEASSRMDKIESRQKTEAQISSIKATREAQICKNEANLKSNKGCNLDSVDKKCNTGQMGSSVQGEVTEGSDVDSRRKFVKNEKSESSEVAQQQKAPKNCLGVIDDGIFSDPTDCEHKSEDLLFKNNNDYSSIVIKDDNAFENSPNEEIPKNFNLTENIRTYTKKCTKRIPVEKDCVKKLTGDAKFDVCKNVYSSTSVNKPHSNVQKPQTNKELIVVLHRLPSNKLKARHSASDIDRNSSIKRKCDRGKTPPKNVRKRKSMDKSENLTEKAPNRVQNHKLSPLQDINPRVTPKENSKLCCDDLNKLKDTFQDSLTPRVLLERIHIDNKSYARSVLANVPGLNDYQMIRPANVNHIVNVVQVSGGRTTQNVPLQNTQTSTQVSPHIQRIGQPRVTDQKPEHSSSLISTTTLTTTTTTAKTTTSQPSTLINILSQQIIRPVTSPTNAVRRQTPFINILSQQIIRPSQTQKTPNANTLTTDNNQAKPPGSTEQAVNTQANNVAKSTLASIKTNTTTTGQGGTILQFICKSSLPKFQQAFGKSVYQNNTEASNTTASTIETTNIAVDAKKNITKTVPVNVQPIQGSVIYSRQMPVGQTISLIPPGGTTRQVFRIATSNSDQISLVKDGHIHSKMSALLAALQGRPKNSEGDQVNSEEKVTLARPTLVQNARIVKPVQLQIPPSVVRTTPQANLSSTTLEQLREFDMVYKQIKERSSSTTPAETSNSPPENQEVTQQRISVTYVNQLQKYTQLSPVVVVSSYSNLQPAASPALSVTSQGSSSPCVTPAPTPTLPKIATKSSKGKTLKNTPNNSTTKSSPVPKPQQKPQEDEHTTQRIFDILAEYAEQLRNSPDLNNKPAPRRRSNPPTNPSQNSKRKKSSSGSKKSGQSSNAIEIDADDITVGSEDSSGGGIVQLSVTDDEQSQAATVNTPESTENSSPSSSRQLILTESPTCGNQSRNLIIADSSVGEALKIPNTAVIVPGSYIMPVSMVKGGQQIAVVSGGSKILATVPARSGQNMLLFQSFMNQNRKGAISAVKYSAIQPISGISSQSLAGVSAQPPVILPSNSVATAVTLGQPLTLKKLNDDRDSNELLLTISQPKEDNKNAEMPQPDSSTSISSDSNDIKMEEGSIQSDNSNEKIFQTFQKSVITNSVATSVIATTSSSCIKDDEENPNQDIITMNLTTDNKVEPKSSERMQSVLVTACSSNGPMLSHTTPRYRKPSDTGRTNNNDLPKEEFLHNGEKTNNTEQKSFRGNVTYYTNKTKKNCADTQKMDSEMQKQAAIERELRLQKSLSEECEDLGVDEPSTSDLFPEADLLFDSNHSPSFDQSSQDIIKRAPQSSEIKEEVKGAMNLFSDDENSSSLRTDLFEYVEYQTVETALDYQARQLMNGNTTSNESGSSGCEDNTLLAKCATMSEVTLNSPISPEMYTESSLNKYKFKYSNRKKGDRMKQGDFGGEIVSSSEDTIGSTELGKINCEDDNFKVVHVAITKTDIVKEDEKCELHCEEDLDSPSGRGARRSVRKLCSCCNGSQDGNISRKRPHTSRPHTPAAPHKKAFLNKKR